MNLHKYHRISIRSIACIVLSLCLLSFPSLGENTNPQAPFKTWSLGLNAGSPGAGLSIQTRYSESVGLRTGILRVQLQGKHQLSLTHPNEKLPVSYQVIAVPVLVDIFPFKRPFRFSLGLSYNGSMAKYDLTPRQEMQMGELVLTPDEVGGIKLDMTWPIICPYVGMGYETFPSGKRLGFGFDCGVFYLGNPTTSLRTSGLYESMNTPEFNYHLGQPFMKYDWYPTLNEYMLVKLK